MAIKVLHLLQYRMQIGQCGIVVPLELTRAKHLKKMAEHRFGNQLKMEISTHTTKTTVFNQFCLANIMPHHYQWRFKTHTGPLMSYSIIELGPHWFGHGLVTYSKPSHCPNIWKQINEIWIKTQLFLSRKLENVDISSDDSNSQSPWWCFFVTIVWLYIISQYDLWYCLIVASWGNHIFPIPTP